jgi:Ser/Thr protein kinase RdoA (MazF antagonist)
MVKGVMANYELDFGTKGIKETRGKRGINIIVDTADGKKLLKQYNHKLDKTTIIHEHSILNRLKDLNFSSPRLVSNKIGESITQYKNRYYALFDFLEGLYQCRDYVFLPHQFEKYIKIAGEMLGLLHEKLKGFVPEGYNPDGFRSQNGDRRRDLEWHLNKLDNCIEQITKPNHDAGKNRQIRFLQKSEDLKNRLIRLDAFLKEVNLVKGTIHGDYGLHNVLFQKDGPPVIIDFEMARMEWRLVDIARTLYSFCGNDVQSSIDKMKIFIRGYQSCVCLTENEFNFFPLVWEYLNIKGYILAWYNYSLKTKHSDLKKAHHSFKRWEWMQAHQTLFLERLFERGLH